MAVEARHIVFHGSANMQATDDGTPQGGAVDKTTKVTFADMKATASIRIHSDSASDATDVFVQVIGRDASGALITNTKVCTGTQPSVIATAYERILKVSKTSATTYVGAIAACQGATASLLGTAQAGGTTWIQLASSAITSNNLFKGKVVRITGGTGIGQFGEIVKTVAADDKCYVRLQDAWATEPDATSTYEIRAGAVLERVLGYNTSTFQVNTVVRPFYNAASDPSTAATFYEKIFVGNVHGTLTLSNSTLTELATGLYDKVSFAMQDALGGTATCPDRRNVAASLPADIGSFYDNTDGAIDFPNSKNFTYSSALGVWLRLGLTAGDSAQNSFYELQVNGQTT